MDMIIRSATDQVMIHTFNKRKLSSCWSILYIYNSSSSKCWRKCRNVKLKLWVVIPSWYGLHGVQVYVTKEDDNPCKDFGIIASECISHVATERSTVVCMFCTFIQASFQTHEGQKTWKTCIEISHHHRYQDASSSKSSGAFCILTCAFDSRIWAKNTWLHHLSGWNM